MFGAYTDDWHTHRRYRRRRRRRHSCPESAAASRRWLLVVMASHVWSRSLHWRRRCPVSRVWSVFFLHIYIFIYNFFFFTPFTTSLYTLRVCAHTSHLSSRRPAAEWWDDVKWKKINNRSSKTIEPPRRDYPQQACSMITGPNRTRIMSDAHIMYVQQQQLPVFGTRARLPSPAPTSGSAIACGEASSEYCLLIYNIIFLLIILYFVFGVRICFFRAHSHDC